MTHSLKLIALAAALACGTAAGAQNLSVTTDNGGTANATRDCVRDGTSVSATCVTNSTATTANGRTGSRTRTRVTDNGSTTTQINGLTGSGRSTDRGRTLDVTRN